MPETATVTIPDVPILKVGTHGGTTGGKAAQVVVTAQHLADMVAASSDPEIDSAPLKLGHTGSLSHLEEDDSEPALGWATNLRLSDDGQTLIADYTDVPASLAEPIKAAFKRRSAEIAWSVKTTAGKTYSAVIDALALLGVKKPAVKGLSDLAELYRPATALASADLEAEAHSWLALYDAMPDQATPAQEIANQVTWAKKAAAELGAMVGLAGLQAVFDALDAMAGPDSRGLLAAAPHHDPVPASSTTGGQMSPKPTLSAEQLATARTKLGLADTATEEQVIAKLSELDDLVQAAKPTPAPTPAGGEGASTEGAGDGVPVLEPAALSAATIAELTKAGLTVLPTPALEQLQANATLGATAASQLAEQRRDGLLDEAERAGKFGVGETATKIRSALAAQLDTNFDGAKAVIDAMPVIVPVTELGHGGNGPEHAALAAAADAAFDAEIADLFAGEIPTAKEA